MKFREEMGLTFDDVLLVPCRSRISSRYAVDTSTQLTPKIRCKIPILSANMDTVTEATMAVAIARAGGIGVIHRFLSPERQAAEVTRVKRAESYVVVDPVTVPADAPLTRARELMTEVGGLLVLDGEGRLVGILTRRDLALVDDAEDGAVGTLMTPRERLVTAPAGIEQDEARKLLHRHRIEKLPLVDEDGRPAGLITSQDIIKLRRHPHATKDERGRLRVGAAVGVRASDVERAERCLNAGADLLVVDVAHGHSDLAIDMVRRLKQNFPDCEVMAGNVATPEGIRDLAGAGAASVKVGVGSGSICITRVVTGAGVPQLTAIMECGRAARDVGVSMVSDGGIRNSGDITKAIAAGAHTVMVGSLLAGTTQSPGASVVRDGRRFKVVRGMASLTANIDRLEVESRREVDPEDWERVVPEGVEAVVPYRGDVHDILHQLVGGLRSGMTYLGASTLEEVYKNAEFVRMTGAGMAESGAHDVTRL
ncbi:MAG: IMP dehydrogenase [Candidatus Eremiobacterota bacterium]